jgi:hypothetical protein
MEVSSSLSPSDSAWFRYAWSRSPQIAKATAMVAQDYWRDVVIALIGRIGRVSIGFSIQLDLRCRIHWADYDARISSIEFPKCIGTMAALHVRLGGVVIGI